MEQPSSAHNPDDAAIDEFHRAARRRKMKIFAITAVLCLAIGIATIVVTFTASEAVSDEMGLRRSVRRYDFRTLILAIGFLVAGAASGYTAYRIAANKVRNEDL